MVLPRRTSASSPFAVAALLAANLLPLAGVVWWGWSVFEVLVLYWLESGVVGALNVPKILLAGGPGDSAADATASSATWQIEGLPTEWLEGRSSTAERAGLASFFVVHYGIFWVVHGVFVFALPLFALAGSPAGGPFGGPFDGGPFGGGPPAGGPFGGGPFGSGNGLVGWGFGTSPASFLLAVVLMVLSHGVSFAANYLGRGEYRSVTPDQQMMRPYGRVTVLHLTIVFGAFLVSALGSPLPALVLLVALKTALDLRAPPGAPAGRGSTGRDDLTADPGELAGPPPT